MPTSGIKSDGPATEFARCILRLANLPNLALDRLSRYEATLWRQACRILYALETLAQRKPQERTRWFRLGSDNQNPAFGLDLRQRILSPARFQACPPAPLSAHRAECTHDRTADGSFPSEWTTGVLEMRRKIDLSIRAIR
jgi:hypothetical protein